MPPKKSTGRGGGKGSTNPQGGNRQSTDPPSQASNTRFSSHPIYSTTQAPRTSSSYAYGDQPPPPNPYLGEPAPTQGIESGGAVWRPIPPGRYAGPPPTGPYNDPPIPENPYLGGPMPTYGIESGVTDWRNRPPKYVDSRPPAYTGTYTGPSIGDPGQSLQPSSSDPGAATLSTSSTRPEARSRATEPQPQGSAQPRSSVADRGTRSSRTHTSSSRTHKEPRAPKATTQGTKKSNPPAPTYQDLQAHASQLDAVREEADRQQRLQAETATRMYQQLDAARDQAAHLRSYVENQHGSARRASEQNREHLKDFGDQIEQERRKHPSSRSTKPNTVQARPDDARPSEPRRRRADVEPEGRVAAVTKSVADVSISARSPGQRSSQPRDERHRNLGTTRDTSEYPPFNEAEWDELLAPYPPMALPDPPSLTGAHQAQPSPKGQKRGQQKETSGTPTLEPGQKKSRRKKDKR